MGKNKVDGIVFVPEVTDDVILRTDLRDAPLHGRAAVSEFILRLEALYLSQQLVSEDRVGDRDIRICRAVLRTGEPIELTTVALRDASGWVCQLHVGHNPVTPVKNLLDREPG